MSDLGDNELTADAVEGAPQSDGKVIGQGPFDRELMLRAIEFARKGDPSPNPHVGCVIAHIRETEFEVVGEGFHAEAGHEHAEVNALKSAGDNARGACAYVTLEPCNHNGRTGPCVDALLAAGITRAVIAILDPNPNVPGKGLEKLRAAGVEVVVGVCEIEANELLEPWTHYITSNSSFLTLKLALSLDGRIATRTGASKWITSPESRAYSHELRANHDAVMVGINTVIADDPRLTVRAAEGRNPIRVIVDSKLRLPLDCNLVRTATEVPTCVLTTESADPEHLEAITQAGVNIVRVQATAEGRCDMQSALVELAKREVVSVLCEGGAELAGSLLAGRLVHRLHAFMAPMLLGPRGRPGAVDWAGPETPSDAPRIARPIWAVHGNDAHVTGRLSYPKSART